MQMKKTFLLAAAIMATSLVAGAVEDNPGYGFVNKLTRGAVNFLTGWVEFPAQVYKGYSEGYDNGGSINIANMPAASRSIGATFGVFRGVGHALGRTIWGVADVITCWAKNPEENDNMLFILDAEYAWQKGEKKTFLATGAQDGFKRVGYRAARGLDGIFFGVMEIPCQTQDYWNEHKNGMVVLGFLDGIWLGCSRITNGVLELGLCPLPGFEENIQVPYNVNHTYDVCTQFDKNSGRLVK